VLFAPAAVVRERTRDVLARAGGRPGHIMNLGHGILPDTPIAAVETLVETVADWNGAPLPGESRGAHAAWAI
jgi:uroporphyrinogen decarboxylase